MPIKHKPGNLTPRRIQAENFVAAVLEPGATYTDVGERLMPNTAYPRQGVYRKLQSPHEQAVLKRMEEESGITRAQFLARVVKHADNSEKAAERAKSSASDRNAATGALTLLGKASGNLVELSKDLTDIPDPAGIRAEAERAIQGLLDAQESA